jgi:hypothetical protein
MKSPHLSTICGLLGAIPLVLFWIGVLAPERIKFLVGPHGLLYWGLTLSAAIMLPVIAAIRGSRWWFVLGAMSTITSIGALILALK